MDKPEFVYQNQILSLKENDYALLEQALAAQEMEAARSNMVSSSTVEPVKEKDGKKGAPAKPDPKAAAKGAPGKPSTASEDKNSPKDVKIDYPEVEAEPNYLLIEKSFQQNKAAKDKPIERKKKEASGAAAKQVLTLEQKKLIRQAELVQQYDAIRALPFSMAVVLRLN